jgi:hypothetical protein
MPSRNSLHYGSRGRQRSDAEMIDLPTAEKINNSKRLFEKVRLL